MRALAVLVMAVALLAIPLPAAAAAEPGGELYILRGCLGCHGASGRGGVGPSLGKTPLPFDAFLKQG